MSPVATGADGDCGISIDAMVSGALGAALLSDCRPIGVGEVNEGVSWSGAAGLAPPSAGGWVAAG